jgi:hypothetical protein
MDWCPPILSFSCHCRRAAASMHRLIHSATVHPLPPSHRWCHACWSRSPPAEHPLETRSPCCRLIQRSTLPAVRLIRRLLDPFNEQALEVQRACREILR